MSERGAGRRSTRDLVVLVLVLALPVVVAGALWLWQARELDQAEDALAEDRAAVNAATALTLAWASVDHREADEYIDPRCERVQPVSSSQQFEARERS